MVLKNIKMVKSCIIRDQKGMKKEDINRLADTAGRVENIRLTVIC